MQKICLIGQFDSVVKSLYQELVNYFQTQFCSNEPEQISDMLSMAKPDLIFLDYDMPEGDGKETFEQIKQMEQAKDVPVVFLTSIRDKKRIEEVLSLKPAGYVLKPAEQSRIFETLEELL